MVNHFFLEWIKRFLIEVQVSKFQKMSPPNENNLLEIKENIQQEKIKSLQNNIMLKSDLQIIPNKGLGIGKTTKKQKDHVQVKEKNEEAKNNEMEKKSIFRLKNNEKMNHCYFIMSIVKTVILFSLLPLFYIVMFIYVKKLLDKTIETI